MQPEISLFLDNAKKNVWSRWKKNWMQRKMNQKKNLDYFIVSFYAFVPQDLTKKVAYLYNGENK